MPHHDELEFAALNTAQIKKLAKLEAKLGVVILAYRTPLRPAPLTETQLAELQKAEAAMPGVCLVAYKAPAKK